MSWASSVVAHTTQHSRAAAWSVVRVGPSSSSARCSSAARGCRRWEGGGLNGRRGGGLLSGGNSRGPRAVVPLPPIA
jgi:hypothetical protein